MSEVGASQRVCSLGLEFAGGAIQDVGKMTSSEKIGREETYFVIVTISKKLYCIPD